MFSLAATVSAAATAADGAAIAASGLPGAPACSTCHGAQGQGQADAGFPRLAGLPAAYLRRQLDAYAAGERRNPTMMPIAKSLSADQRDAVVKHYAALPLAASAAAGTAATTASKAASAPPRDTPGQVLATRGRWSSGIPACEQCHAPGGRGVGSDFPPLAAQPANYLAAQLKAWRSGDRPPGPLGLMTVIASKLEPGDIDSVARYFAAMPATEGR